MLDYNEDLSFQHTALVLQRLLNAFYSYIQTGFKKKIRYSLHY